MGSWNLPPKGGYMEAAKKMYYQTMTKLDVEERLKQDDVIIIPVGSTENHGAAGPIGEDTFVVTRIAEMVAEKTGCTVAEPVWYGSHPFHHIGQPCTIPLPDNVFIDFLRAIITGFWNTVSASRFLSVCIDRSIHCLLPFRNGERSIRFRPCFTLWIFRALWDKP